MQELNSLNQLPAPLYEQLEAYQVQQGHDNLLAALTEILQDYFQTQLEPSDTLEVRLVEAEKRLTALTREVVHLRQDVPSNYDRLREQLATVRLSHSGLLQNLRDRIEVLEQALEEAIPQELNPVEPG